MLQDCFHHTDWDVFKGQDTDNRVSLDNYTSTVLDYIYFCVDNVTCWRQFRVFPNTPPWMTHGVQQLIRARDSAFHSGDQEAYSAARANLKRGINTAKHHHRRRIEARFDTTTNPRQVWEGIRAITDYKRKTPPPSADSPTLAEDLNLFYARFDRDNTDPVLPPLPSTDPAPVLSTHEVRCVFRSINTRKAAGPDGVLGRVLKDCAAELADVFTSIFNTSLSCSLVPVCFKAAIIVPIPKQSNVLTTTDLWHSPPFPPNAWRDWSLNTSKPPYHQYWIHTNLPTERTGQLRMPLPRCCTHCWSTWSIRTPMHGSSLCTIVRLLIPSGRSNSGPNSTSWDSTPPCAIGLWTF
ncbi:uncharacterized protein LOC132875344 [Neoarius graeffei]|uniref:uncharacterized protein LOC132875344 n=1 Tax=Neoarius graeffei TaxID=443677 RepID=UPI00298D4756|nr:uncharacterized protein LOC132875344 [Neoarius graeffei]